MKKNIYSILGVTFVICILIGISFKIVDNKTNQEAKSNEGSMKPVSEYKTLIENFVVLIYENDKNTFKPNVELALNYIDKPSGDLIFEEFKNSELLDTYINQNMKTTIKVDSISINRELPTEAQVYLKQGIAYKDTFTFIPLAFKCNFENIKSSEKNPYGIVITHFNYIAYSPK